MHFLTILVYLYFINYETKNKTTVEMRFKSKEKYMKFFVVVVRIRFIKSEKTFYLFMCFKECDKL